MQVEQHVLLETNKLTKSIQVMLNVLNELRLCHVMERAGTGSMPNKQENLKVTLPSWLSFPYSLVDRNIATYSRIPRLYYQLIT